MFTAYPAIFPHGDAAVWVEFTDLPSHLTQGDTLEEAAAMARDALSGFLVLLRGDEKPVASPSDPASLQVQERSEVHMVESFSAPPYTRKMELRQRDTEAQTEYRPDFSDPDDIYVVFLDLT